MKLAMKPLWKRMKKPAKTPASEGTEAGNEECVYTIPVYLLHNLMRG